MDNFLMGITSTSMDHLADSISTITDVIAEETPVVGNIVICSDCLYTTSSAGIGFCCAPNPVSKVFFGTSCAFGVMGATSSGTALVTSFMGIPMAGWVGALGARSFHKLGKVSLRLGTTTSGNPEAAANQVCILFDVPD